jgi:rhodanese-related sulfurtransferase
MIGILSRLARLIGGDAEGPIWVEIDELRAQIDRGKAPLILDVRGPDEFDGPLGHIEGARNVPLPELPAHTGELAQAPDPIVCVCLTDKRSSQAAADLTKAGIDGVSVLRGGMKAWRAAP